MTDALPFIDLAAQRRYIGGAMDEAILRVVHHGGYIMGPEVTRRPTSRPSAARRTWSPVLTAPTLWRSF